jgi:GNAT superfamily N-acetyltransferase
MNIHIATSDEDIAACYPVMRELRPHIAEDRFLAQVRRQQGADYRLAMAQEANAVVAVAGFRVSENLAWGRFLYVDDLVTLPAQRSIGYGAALLSWLREYAAAEGCGQLHLDSGAQRLDAHRFYEREGMANAGFHFVVRIESDDNS